ncbi:MAG: hypothetical protein I8H66_13490 [Sphingobacteriia bacterium]|nr:hypothetical protein [Sphingobacteriia bacterium]
MTDQMTDAEDEISLKELLQKAGDWWSYLKTQWWKIAMVGFIGGVIGFVYASMQPVTYTAKTTFVVEEGKSSSSGLGGLASLAGQFGVDMGGGSGGGLLSGDNILLYFKSPSLAREVLLTQYDSSSNQSVADIYASVYHLREGWEQNEKIGKAHFPPTGLSKSYTRLQDSLLQKMIEGIIKTQFTVGKTDKKAGFIDVTATMQDESLAKVYCERIVKLAVEKYVGIKTQRQKATVDKLQVRVDSIANLLRQKTVSGASLQTSSSTMDINPLYRTGTAVAVETTVRDKTMLATIFASVTQNLEMAKFTLSQETPVIQIVDVPIFPLNKEKKSRLKTAINFSLACSLVLVLFLIAKRVSHSILD